MPLYGPNFLLTSTMYPMEVEASAQIAPPTFSAVLWGIDVENAVIAIPTFSGEHVQTLFPGVYALTDDAEIAVPSLAGTHVQTLFARAYSLDDSASIATPAFSATNIQTLFPLAYLMEPQEISIAPPTFSGTLV